MKPEEYQFSVEEIEQIKKYRDQQQDSRLKQRFIALLLLASGQNQAYISSILGVSQSSIYQWFNQYSSKGIHSLHSFQYQSKSCFLGIEQVEELTDWVKKTPLEIEK